MATRAKKILPFTLWFLATSNLAFANEHSPEAAAHAPEHRSEPATAPTTKAPRAAVTLGPTVAMNARSGQAVRVGEIYSVGEKNEILVDKGNTQIELAPFSVAEFSPEGEMKLLRGSALLTSRGEVRVRTTSAQLEFSGRILLSHDHKERSTSVFVLEGEARMENPQDLARSLRLERLRGATLELGGVLPQLVRQLDFASLQSWLKGYAWSANRSAEILREVPATLAVVKEEAPAHLREVKLGDYFSAVESADEFSQPDYYEQKFADPDVAIAQANSTKEDKKVLSPEEAALISLGETKIKLDFDIVSAEQKNWELSQPHHSPKKEIAKGRALASVRAQKKEAATESAGGVDPDVKEVLDRLREIKPRATVVSGAPRSESRSPASLGMGLVPDPVYDYSENF